MFYEGETAVSHLPPKTFLVSGPVFEQLGTVVSCTVQLLIQLLFAKLCYSPNPVGCMQSHNN